MRTLVGSTALTACATTDAYGNRVTTKGSSRAAMQGAVAGAALGALAKSDGDRSDIGKTAAIGAAKMVQTGYVLSDTSPNYPCKISYSKSHSLYLQYPLVMLSKAKPLMVWFFLPKR